MIFLLTLIMTIYWLIKSQYKLGIALIGLATINHYLGIEDDTEDLDISMMVFTITKIISPILLPMIKSIGELDLDKYITKA